MLCLRKKTVVCKHQNLGFLLLIYRILWKMGIVRKMMGGEGAVTLRPSERSGYGGLFDSCTGCLDTVASHARAAWRFEDP